MNKTALIVGATSSLGHALCQSLGRRGWNLVLMGRDVQVLEALACDVRIRHRVEARTLAANFLDALPSTAQLAEQAGSVDSVFLLTGDMGNGEADRADNIARVTQVNFTAPTQMISWFAYRMAATGDGSIVVVSSVAGDRGRASNYVYGSAKAALTAFASGLRNRYAKQGVHIMTVKPGFIDTPMTWGMTSPLIAPREKVAETIVRAMEKRRDVIYVPWFWWWIMVIIRSIPERVFKRLSL